MVSMSDTPDNQGDLLAQVVRHALFGADRAAIASQGETPAEQTRQAVTEAFKLALGNGLIRLVPQDEWPEYVALDPPYDPEAPWGRGERRDGD